MKSTRAVFRRTGFLHMVALGDVARSDPYPEWPDSGRFGSITTALRLRSPCDPRLTGSPQLQQVVNRAQNPPLTAHLGQPAQRELTEAQHLLQLAEDRLDDPLPLRVHRAALLRPQL